MEMQEKLTFFHKLICSNYPLFLWNYDADFNLSDTTATWDLIAVADFIPAVRFHLAAGQFTPLILETNVGLLWIIGFARREGVLKSIHFLGPVVTGKDTSDLLRQKLETYELSVHIHAIVSRMISQAPEIPNSILTGYAVMLHYALNEETIPVSAVSFFVQDRKRPSPAGKTTSISAESLWKREQQLCQMFEQGDPAAVSAVLSMLSVTAGMDLRIKDTVRKDKNNAMILLTLCSRSCIRGGMHPSVAYDLNETYAGMLEECRTTGEVVRFCKEMVSGYMAQMQRAGDASLSPAIQNVCYYIRKHLSEPLSMEELAGMTGYTEYYFSHKFQKETGITVKEFILNEKITRAKLLLADSSKSIQEIGMRFSVPQSFSALLSSFPWSPAFFSWRSGSRSSRGSVTHRTRRRPEGQSAWFWDRWAAA